jgi:hypothetical protein
LETRDCRQDAKQFLGFTTVAEGEDDIAIRDHPQVTVERVERVQNDCRRTGTGEGGRNFFSDVAGFPDTKNNDLAARLDCLFD